MEEGAVSASPGAVAAFGKRERRCMVWQESAARQMSYFCAVIRTGVRISEFVLLHLSSESVASAGWRRCVQKKTGVPKKQNTGARRYLSATCAKGFAKVSRHEETPEQIVDCERVELARGAGHGPEHAARQMREDVRL